MINQVKSKEIFEKLIMHLVNIEEQSELIVDEYYSDITLGRDAFEETITEYIKKIEGILSDYHSSNKSKELCPFVIIGSIVEIENLKSKEIKKYQIISPFYNRPTSKVKALSYLSSLGKELLFKKPKEEVTIKDSMNKNIYSVKRIQMFEDKK